MRRWQLFSVILGFLWVLLGAIAGHGTLANEAADYFFKAHRYHIVHTLALLWLTHIPNFSRIVAVLWSLGIICFSGTLYFLSIQTLPIQWIVPIGGIAFLLGWAALFSHLWIKQ